MKFIIFVFTQIHLVFKAGRSIEPDSSHRYSVQWSESKATSHYLGWGRGISL